MRNTLLVFATASAIAGCATTSQPTTSTTLVPTSRIANGRYLVRDENRKGLVVIKRDKARFGLNCDNALFVDGQRIALIEPSERLELYLSLDEHVLSASKPTCGGETRELAVTPSADATKAFRIWSDQNGQLQFQPTAF